MRLKIAAVATFGCVVSCLANITEQTIGNTTFINGTDANGNFVSGTSQKIGNMTFHNLNNSDGTSVQGSSMTLGNQTFHNLNTSGGTQINGTSMELGNTTFHNFTDSKGGMANGTTTRIGNTAFSNISTSDGQINGMKTKLGGSSFTSFPGSARKSESITDIELETLALKEEIFRLRRELEIERENAEKEKRNKARSRRAKEIEQTSVPIANELDEAQEDPMEQEEPQLLSRRKPSRKLASQSEVENVSARTLTLADGSTFRVSLTAQYKVGAWEKGEPVEVYKNFDKRGNFKGYTVKNVSRGVSLDCQ